MSSVVEKTVRREDIEGTLPLLTTLAVERSPSSELPGRYCPDRDVWVIDGSGGPLPIVVAGAMAIDPVTKVKGERDEPALRSLLQLATKTRSQMERDDFRYSDLGMLPELVTKTDVIRERDDTRDGYVVSLLELMTKTEVKGERDEP